MADATLPSLQGNPLQQIIQVQQTPTPIPVQSNEQQQSQVQQQVQMQQASQQEIDRNAPRLPTQEELDVIRQNAVSQARGVQAYGGRPAWNGIPVNSPEEAGEIAVSTTLREARNNIANYQARRSVEIYESRIPEITSRLRASGVQESQIGDIIAKGQYEAQHGAGSFEATIAQNEARAAAGVPSGFSFKPQAIINETERAQNLVAVGLPSDLPYNPVTGVEIETPTEASRQLIRESVQAVKATDIAGIPFKQTITAYSLLGAPSGATTTQKPSSETAMGISGTSGFGSTEARSAALYGAKGLADAVQQYFNAPFSTGALQPLQAKQEAGGTYRLSLPSTFRDAAQVNLLRQTVESLKASFPGAEIEQVSPYEYVVKQRAAPAAPPKPLEVFGPPRPPPPAIASSSIFNEEGNIQLPVTIRDASGKIIPTAPLSNFDPSKLISSTNIPIPGTVLRSTPEETTVAGEITIENGVLTLNTITTKKAGTASASLYGPAFGTGQDVELAYEMASKDQIDKLISKQYGPAFTGTGFDIKLAEKNKDLTPLGRYVAAELTPQPVNAPSGEVATEYLKNLPQENLLNYKVAYYQPPSAMVQGAVRYPEGDPRNLVLYTPQKIGFGEDVPYAKAIAEGVDELDRQAHAQLQQNIAEYKKTHPGLEGDIYSFGGNVLDIARSGIITPYFTKPILNIPLISNYAGYGLSAKLAEATGKPVTPEQKALGERALTYELPSAIVEGYGPPALIAGSSAAVKYVGAATGAVAEAATKIPVIGPTIQAAGTSVLQGGAAVANTPLGQATIKPFFAQSGEAIAKEVLLGVGALQGFEQTPTAPVTTTTTVGPEGKETTVTRTEQGSQLTYNPIRGLAGVTVASGVIVAGEQLPKIGSAIFERVGLKEVAGSPTSARVNPFVEKTFVSPEQAEAMKAVNPDVKIDYDAAKTIVKDYKSQIAQNKFEITGLTSRYGPDDLVQTGFAGTTEPVADRVAYLQAQNAKFETEIAKLSKPVGLTPEKMEAARQARMDEIFKQSQPEVPKVVDVSDDFGQIKFGDSRFNYPTSSVEVFGKKVIIFPTDFPTEVPKMSFQPVPSGPSATASGIPISGAVDDVASEILGPRTRLSQAAAEVGRNIQVTPVVIPSTGGQEITRTISVESRPGKTARDLLSGQTSTETTTTTTIPISSEQRIRQNLRDLERQQRRNLTGESVISQNIADLSQAQQRRIQSQLERTLSKQTQTQAQSQIQTSAQIMQEAQVQNQLESQAQQQVQSQLSVQSQLQSQIQAQIQAQQQVQVQLQAQQQARILGFPQRFVSPERRKKRKNIFGLKISQPRRQPVGVLPDLISEAATESRYGLGSSRAVNPSKNPDIFKVAQNAFGFVPTAQQFFSRKRRKR